jgi:hypothetical protein
MLRSGFYSGVLLQRSRRGLKRSLLASGLLHGATVFFLLQFPFTPLWEQYFPPPRDILAEVASDPTREILYLPVLKTPGPGGKPGQGDRPGPVKKGGSTRLDLRFTAVSKPPAPDNRRQTILQPLQPPELRLRQDVPMPDLVLARVKVEAPQPPPKPVVPIASIRRPSPPLPRPKPPAPVVTSPQLPQPPVVSELTMVRPPTLANLSPKLALPEPPPPEPAPVEASAGEQAAAIAFPGLESTVDLLSLSIQPEALGGPVTLPAGQRYGEFSISPNAGPPGALGGAADGVEGAGTGGPGPGGDASVAPGSGTSGGGGGDSGFQGRVTIAPLESAGSLGELPAILRNWIYPVGEVPVVSRGGFVISAGPTGGGGLRIYGVLRGGKVYTTYLAMPERNWVLEYSVIPSGEEKAVRSGAIQLSMDNGLAPPYPKEKFDFYRPASVPQRGNRRIVLHGVIREDGAVEELKVLQGVHAEADELARVAFSQWKFRPASRGDQPVAVEILVGIPASGPSHPDPPGESPLATRAP